MKLIKNCQSIKRGEHVATNKPIQLAKETVSRVSENRRRILSEKRETTGDARSAFTKSPTIPDWTLAATPISR